MQFSTLLVLVSLILSVWISYILYKAFKNNPEILTIFKKSFKRDKNRMKVHNFSEYPLVIHDGLAIEVAEVKRHKCKIWNIRINVFNLSNHVKSLKMTETVFDWGKKDKIILNDENIYRMEPATGLVSSSKMSLWSFKKPEQIFMLFTINNVPGSAYMSLKQEKTMSAQLNKAQSEYNKTKQPQNTTKINDPREDSIEAEIESKETAIEESKTGEKSPQHNIETSDNLTNDKAADENSNKKDND